MQYENYVSHAIRLWDAMNVENRYVSIWAYTNSTYCELTDCIEYMQEDKLLHIIQEGKSYDVVVFESLPTSLFELIVKIPNDKIVIWQSVGCDIYYDDYPYRAAVPIKIYKPITRRYIHAEQRKRLSQKALWQRLYYEIAQIVHFQRTYHRWKAAKEEEKQHLQLQSTALRRIDYLSTVLDIEYRLICQNKDIQARFFHFKYLGEPINFNYWKIVDFDKTQYILLGNSCDASNNHLDILHLLKQRKITTPIYVPLAYAGTGKYPDHVAEIIGKCDGNVVQRDFVAKKQYDAIMQSIRVGVFGHMRQQALGNITAMLLQGCKVFLYKDSIAYRHFRQRGAYIFTIEDDLSQENIDTPLTSEQINHNRSMFENEYINITTAIREDLKEIAAEIKQRKKSVQK